MSQNIGNNGQEEKQAHKACIIAFKSHLKIRDSLKVENKVERYLVEPCVNGNKSFNVLEWWKGNVSRFQVLLIIAKDDVLNFIVASKLAFGIGGNVLDIYKISSLPKTYEALICCKNWIKCTLFQFEDHKFIKDVESYENIEKC